MACSSRATDEPFTIYYIDHQGILQEHVKEVGERRVSCGSSKLPGKSIAFWCEP
jgi:hypothetical protein